ncbi:MAG: 3-isopropylmalate dehydratase large subunit [Acidobacteriia bacterium]|nr:3-isopropylmalate dehydratase large subunit [Terriglobia bacterium]
MTGKTISEKILSEKSGRDARAGDLVVCAVDYAMATDGSAPMAIDYFDEMGGSRVFDPDRIVFVMDHYCSRAHSKTSELQKRMRAFAQKQGIGVHDVGAGICHQLMIETGRTRPGGLLVGADSHSVTGGALNAFATGIGSSDLAATMICGRIWLKVPQTIKVTLTGHPGSGIYAKDMALALAGMLGADGAAYQTLEFDGPAATGLDVEDRLVLSNMSVEMGAKAGIFKADRKTLQYLGARTAAPLRPVEADADARYSREITLEVSELAPMIARPHAVDNVAAIGTSAGTPVQMVFLGTCTAGRVRDFHQALRILNAVGRIAPGVQLVVTPASTEVEAELRRDGTLDRLAALGATILPPGCGPCCGTAGPTPADGVNVMSTANRNFKARMGNAAASIYLASPAACAAAAATGRITDPREIEGRSK